MMANPRSGTRPPVIFHYPRGALVSIFVGVCICTAGFCRAATFYVSPDGNDAGSGLSPGTAWKTIEKAAAAPLAGGDRILLHCGGIWHTSFTIWANGAPGRPIVVGSYGSGDKPCIDGGDVIDPTSWQATSTPGVYRANVGRKIDRVWRESGPPLEAASSLAELARGAGDFYCDGASLYVRPPPRVGGPVVENTGEARVGAVGVDPRAGAALGKDARAGVPGADPRTGVVRYETPAREVCVEISRSNIALRSIAVRHAGRADRGAVTVWADHSLWGIEISDCAISDNAGRGVWLDGAANNSITNVSIVNNRFEDNDGSGALIILADGGKITGNRFDRNCRRAIEQWQAGIRLWSSGVRNLLVADNAVFDERWRHGGDSSMGIHCDETGEKIVIRNNEIRNVDHEGIEVENTSGVDIEKNTAIECNIGILINRAGHHHIIRNNQAIDCRSQGIAMQGWLAHGVNAQPEVLVEGRLFTLNLVEGNRCLGSRWGELKAVGGAEYVEPPLGDIFRGNDFGPERPGFIEWGDQTFDTYDQWPVAGGASHDR